MRGIDTRRIIPLNSISPVAAPVLYWMSREQRVADNWGLLYAQELALEMKQPLVVVFTLSDSFLGASVRHYGFMLRGLEQVATRLEALNIPFVLLRGEPAASICHYLNEYPAGALVTDFDPLRIKRQWRETVARESSVACFEVDSHNVVPCRFVSSKQEFGAYTLRPKIHRLLPEFLTTFPKLERHSFSREHHAGERFPDDVESLVASLPFDAPVAEVPLPSGEEAAVSCMDDFIGSRLDRYDLLRNDPNASGQSGLSPYMHFGQIAPQRVALEVARAAGGTASGDAFLEELIVRRELSDNFCWYNHDYDCVAGFPEWAQKNHALHRHDRREYLYDRDVFECGATHDPLWNAAQQEMVTSGKMHGYLRMYWAKKILEWTSSPDEAMATAVYLNDRYQLDGRDPNGYAGIAWSIGGVHDRAWGTRPVFGKIRYMNDRGCRRKFDVDRYISCFAPH